MTAKEMEIQNYMTKLGISYEEATQLWEDDQEDYIGEEGEAMTAKAKEIKRYEKKPTERKKVTRERKVDETKKHLLLMMKVLLEGKGADVIGIKTETEINFVYNDENYTLKLTKHRNKKQSIGRFHKNGTCLLCFIHKDSHVNRQNTQKERAEFGGTSNSHLSIGNLNKNKIQDLVVLPIDKSSWMWYNWRAAIGRGQPLLLSRCVFANYLFEYLVILPIDKLPEMCLC